MRKAISLGACMRTHGDWWPAWQRRRWHKKFKWLDYGKRFALYSRRWVTNEWPMSLKDHPREIKTQFSCCCSCCCCIMSAAEKRRRTFQGSRMIGILGSLTSLGIDRNRNRTCLHQSSDLTGRKNPDQRLTRCDASTYRRGFLHDQCPRRIWRQGSAAPPDHWEPSTKELKWLPHTKPRLLAFLILCSPNPEWFEW